VEWGIGQVKRVIGQVERTVGQVDFLCHDLLID